MTKLLPPTRRPTMWHVLLVVLLLPNHIIGMTVSPAASKPVKKIAVIGSGIAGLSLVHALHNADESLQVSLYESRRSLDYAAGAGIQLNGGMSVLRKINPKLQRAVADAALPLTTIRSRTKPWFGNGDYDTLLEIPLKEAIEDWGGKLQEDLIVDSEVMFYTIMRGALQQVLVNSLPKKTRVNYSKSLAGISGQQNSGISIKFDDNTEEGPFDLVVGCDGINSAVKEYIETGTISESGTKKSQTIYSGIRVRYAIQDNNVEYDNQGAEFKQYFGSGAYALGATFGNGKGKSPVKGAYITFLDNDYLGPFRKNKEVTQEKITSKDENADWTQDVRRDTTSSMLNQLDENAIPDFEVRPIIEASSRVFELGVYFHNPISLSGWSKEVNGSGEKYCTLVGDSAHAMPPFLGQGGNQAIQDGYCLAQKILAYNSGETTASFKDSLKSYENIRWWPTASITAKASFLGYLEASSGFIGKFRDVFFLVMGKVGVARKVFFDSAMPKIE